MSSERTYRKHFIVMDVDSTLIDEEVIDLIADEAGVGEKIAAITAAAMRGELDFHAALKERVSMLTGLPVSIFPKVLGRVHFTKGVLRLISTAHKRGWKVGVVSGGFHEIVDDLVAQAGIDYALANRLGIQRSSDGTVVLSGSLNGPIVDKAVKLDTLQKWVTSEGLTMEDAIAIGDGANDIPMLQAAGFGIAFCAKPAVKTAVPAHLDVRDLMQALPLIDAHDAHDTQDAHDTALAQ
ncbi:MAG: phosphoserine phosphatase SerB [Bifidobacteriaceae bacterium]|jgi:phosphoserine phosphatase|nr:phosphoserine phosphatase SerB [Bifidobacteriaceae bacterium]